MIVDVKTEYEVIDLLNEGYSLARYGDGEFFKIMIRKTSISNLQEYDENLKKKLFQVFVEPLDRLLIGIPYMKKGVKPWVSKFEREFSEFIVEKRALNSIFGSAFFSRPFLVDLDSKEYFEKVKNIWKDREIVLVNFNPDLPNHFLFQDSKVNFIFIPRCNCFREYNVLLQKCNAFCGQEVLFLVSAGPTANCLAYDLTQIGEQCIDIGQIALEYCLFKGEDNIERWNSQNSYNYEKKIIGKIGLNWKNLDETKVDLSENHKYRNREKCIQSCLRLTNQYLPHYKRSRSVVDFSSGNGVFLEVMRYFGNKVLSVDISGYEGFLISSKIPYKIHDCSKFPYPVFDKSYDLVSCIGAISCYGPDWNFVLDEFARIARNSIFVIANEGAMFRSYKYLLDDWSCSGWNLVDRQGTVYKWEYEEKFINSDSKVMM